MDPDIRQYLSEKDTTDSLAQLHKKPKTVAVKGAEATVEEEILKHWRWIGYALGSNHFIIRGGGGRLEDFFSDYFFQLMLKLDFFFHTPFEARFFYDKELKVRFLK